MPRHPDKQRPVVAVVGGPPRLRGGHHFLDVPRQGVNVDGRDLRGIVERRTHRVSDGRVLVQYLQIEPVGPPVLVSAALDGVFHMTHDGTAVASGSGGGFCNGWVLLGHSIPSRSWCYRAVITDVIAKCRISNNQDIDPSR